MRTLQGMRMNVDYMMEQIRINSINDTFEKFKKADKHYYETSDGGSEVTKLIKELGKLDLFFKIKSHILKGLLHSCVADYKLSHSL